MGKDRVGGSNGSSAQRNAEAAQRRAQAERQERIRAEQQERAREARQEEVRARNQVDAQRGVQRPAGSGQTGPASDRFERAPTTPGGVTAANVAPTAQSTEVVAAAEQEIRASVADIGIEEGDDKKDATLVAAQAVEEQLALIEDPAERLAVVQRLQPELLELGDNLQYLDGGQTEEAIAHLTRAAETLGTEGASALSSPIAHGLHATIRADGDNLGELEDAITHAIENGDGALFGATLGNSLNGVDPEIQELVHSATSGGIQTLNENFNEASEAFAEVEAEVAGFLFEFGDTLDPEQRDAAVQTVFDRHEEELGAFDEAAEELSTTLSAVSLFPNPVLGNPGTQGLATVSGQVRENLERIADSEAGQVAIADAVADVGNGGTNWITAANDTISGADAVANAVIRSVTARAHSLLEGGDFAGAANLFRGVEGASPLLGVSDPAQLNRLTSLLDGQAANPIPADQFARRFSREAEELGGQLGRNGNTVVDGHVRALGLVVAGATLLGDVSRLGEANAEEQFRTLVGASGLAADLAPFISTDSAVAGNALRQFGTLSRAGVVLDAVDTVRAVQRGDFAEASISAAGLVGGILTTTSLGGPVGTAIGAVLSVGAIGGQLLLDHIRADREEDGIEEDLQAFLEAGGLDEFQAEILRDVTRGGQESIGRIFTQIGEELNATPREVLEWFTSSTDVEGIHQIIVDQIEGYERNDEGEFTDQAVQDAIALIENHFGPLNGGGVVA